MRQNTVESYFKRQTDRQTKIQTNIQTKRKTDRHTDGQTDGQTARQTDRLTEYCKFARSPSTIVCENMNFLQAAIEQLELIWRTEGKPQKETICFCMVFFKTTLTPSPTPPHKLLDSFKELFFKPNFIRTKIPQCVWILVILLNFTWKMSQPLQKINYSHHLWNVFSVSDVQYMLELNCLCIKR